MTDRPSVDASPFVPSSETVSKFPFTATDVRHTPSDIAIMHETVKALDQGLVPSADIVSTILLRSIQEAREIRHRSLNEGLSFSGSGEDFATFLAEYYVKLNSHLKDVGPEIEKIKDTIPWLDSTNGSTTRILQEDSSWLDERNGEISYYIMPGVSKTLPHGIFIESAAEEPLEQVADVAFERLPSSEKNKVIEWALSLYEKECDLPMGVDLFLIKNARTVEQHVPILHDIYIHAKDYSYTRFTHSEDEYGNTNALITSLHLYQPRDAEVYLQACMRLPEVEHSELLRIALDVYNYPTMIDAVRKLVKEQPSYEALGKRLLGLPEDDDTVFHTNLTSVYEALSGFFETYPANVEANTRELQIIASVVREVNPTIVVDLGCGTGRIANGLAQEKIAGVGEIVGIDVSSDNLASAEKAHDGLSGESTPVRYQQGDWNAFQYVYDKNTDEGEWKSNLNLPKGSTDVMIAIGRTLTHAEDERRFDAILDQVYDALTDDGVFIFDFPDPNKGAYLENRKKFLGILQDFGLPVTDEFLPNVEYVVDSADGKNVYNRYIPQLDKLKAIMGERGFDVEEVTRAPISGELWEGSENVYFKARKVPHATLLPRLSQTSLSSSPQSEDDVV